MCAAAGSRLRIGGVEAVDVGQQHQLVGLHHLGDPGGQPVVVAEADFGGRDGVVLVDDRHAAERRAGGRASRARSGSGGGPRCPRGSAAAARRSGRSADSASRPGLRQPDLPDRRRRLLFLQPQPASRSGPALRRASAMAPELTTITSVAAAPAARRCPRRRRRARPARGGGWRRVDHQRAADLDHQPRVRRARAGAVTAPPLHAALPAGLPPRVGHRARSTSVTPRPRGAGQQQHRAAGRLRQRGAARARSRAASSRRSCSAR